MVTKIFSHMPFGESSSSSIYIHTYIGSTEAKHRANIVDEPVIPELYNTANKNSLISREGTKQN